MAFQICKKDIHRQEEENMFDIEYGGIAADSLEVKISERPHIPTPKKRYKSISIPGRSGDLIEADGEYEDIEIPIKMNFIADPEEGGMKYRKIKKWLLSGANVLVFSDDASVFFKVKNVSIDDIGRVAKVGWTFKALFLCDPYTYLLDGIREYNVEELIYNPYEVAHPIYKIAGEGTCSITVNGKVITVNVGQNMTIDTDRMLAYREDGTLINTSITGEYEDMYLVEGENIIRVSKGFKITVIPNWRCL